MSRVLLDVDGVVLRDYALLDHVRNNVVRYVSKKLPNVKNPNRLNNTLYKKYGHTAKGLFIEFGIEANDFDEFVYDKYLLAHLSDYILHDKNFENDCLTVRNILENGTPVHFFSNAPNVWTESVREAIDLRIQNYGPFMKPDLHSYLFFGNSRDVTVFVDDKLNNLTPCMFLENWKPLHFSNVVQTHSIDTINSLNFINNYL